MADPKTSDAKAVAAPDYWPELAPVRSGSAEGRLMIGRCEACDEPHYYPRAICPFCLGKTRFEAAEGQGVIYSLSTLRRGPQGPAVVAYVILSEGPSVLARILTEDPDRLSIGQSVRFLSKPHEGRDLAPSFIPITEMETRS